MSPDRLNPDQRLLFDVLNEIWDREAGRIITAYTHHARRVMKSSARHSRRAMTTSARHARRLLLGGFLIASVATGITLGAVWQMRLALKQTAGVIQRLSERGEMDRELILHARREQERAALERIHLALQLARLRQQERADLALQLARLRRNVARNSHGRNRHRDRRNP